MDWAGRHVVLGVSGGIASYKSCLLARRLTELGARVDVVLSQAAARFVGPVTFEALTGRPVLTSLWQADTALQHVRLGQVADLLVVAPATANLLARLAQGLADDVLTAVLLARTAPLLLAPAMNDEMYAAPSTQANLALLRAQGVHLVGPEVGALAEGPSERPGRMSEPDAIVAAAARVLRRGGPLDGRRVLVTAGATREALDPVRVISNRATGKMGFALATAAWERGAEVTLVAGPSPERAPAGVTRVDVESTAEMAAAVRAALPDAEVLVMAAAPADFRPASAAAEKRPRGGAPLVVELTGTDDILLGTRASRRPGAVIVGFALETGNAIAKGRAKLERKDLDLIVVNDQLEPGAGVAVDTNRVTLLDREGDVLALPLLPKRDVAERILDAVEARLRG